MKLKYLLILLGMTFLACQKATIDFGNATAYYPSASQLHQGIAYKYYRHDYPKDKNGTPSSNIEYHTLQVLPNNVLVDKKYDAGLELRSENHFVFENNIKKMVKRVRLFKRDTLDTKLLKGESENWLGKGTAYSVAEIYYPTEWKVDFSAEQTGFQDTILQEVGAKKISKNAVGINSHPTKDSVRYEYTQYRIYKKGLGLWEERVNYEKSISHLELIEQMSLSEFEKRAQHGKKRMAYIDPTLTLDDHSDFKICDKLENIGDYYNCNSRGELLGGKGMWWRILGKELIPEKLAKESGFLTFRFILNCEGEIGRIVCEGTNLDFKKKVFPEETIQHLYEILIRQKDWQVCQTDDRKRDAYTYITFKLKDGKIIDLLP